MHGISRASVVRAMQLYGVTARDQFAAQHIRNAQATIPLTARQEQLIFGSLLGDACLHRDRLVSNKTGIERQYLGLDFFHTEAQLPYLLHKRDIMGPSRKTGRTLNLITRTSGHGSRMVGIVFKHTPTLEPVADVAFGTNDKKYVSDAWVEKLDWEGLAFWYQDDGSLRRSKTNDSVIFYTNAFSTEEVERLRGVLGRFGVEHTRIAWARQNSGHAQPTIACGRRQEVTSFLTKIAPFVVPSMRYKLRCLPAFGSCVKGSELN